MTDEQEQQDWISSTNSCPYTHTHTHTHTPVTRNMIYTQYMPGKLTSLKHLRVFNKTREIDA